jgi:hypothetical protein
VDKDMETGMRNVILTAVSGVAILAGSSFAQDTRTLEVTAFDSIDAGGGFELIVTIGDEYSVRYEGDESDFEKLEFDIRQNELRLKQKSRFFGISHGLDIVVYVTMPEIESLDFSRGVDARVDGLSGGELDVDISTGADVDLYGTCSDLEVDISTGAMLDAHELVCANVEVDASTGASSRVYASDYVDASASMGADVRVYGSPEHYNSDSSMGGSVRMDRNS